MTNTYLYGMGRIAQESTAGDEYFLGDALGSVRQLVAEDGAISLARRYAPYGEMGFNQGSGATPYGFTGEWRDGTGLVNLRARYYAPWQGRFITKDPSGLETNLFQYGIANPINRTDPTGLFSLPPKEYLICFDLHSLSKGARYQGDTSQPFYFITAREAVEICKIAYSQDTWNKSGYVFNFNGERPASGQDLFGWFLFEHGDNSHLVFHAYHPLTRELSKSTLINHTRLAYYLLGDTPTYEYKFNIPQQILCFTDWIHNYNRLSFPISCVLGSFYYQIKTLENNEVGFRIDNRTDLASGTHIAGRFPGDAYGGSIEELITQKNISGNEPLFNIINQTVNGKKVLSILKERTRQQTGSWADTSGNTHQLGGGNLVQTYVWKEKRNSCTPFVWYLIGFVPYLEIQPWAEYANYSDPIIIWGESQ